ncbi:phage holin family protein [uncultured Jatrophihabitans sp.]|uniref:phage holin family protein n=1 Tax=uncultured Jatrophihabitans sp. TaxID=1610747 RepID=UPI0035CAB116
MTATPSTGSGAPGATTADAVPNSSGPNSAGDASIGELIGRVSEQTSRLLRDELRLAQAELTAKGKRAGIGAGLFGGAGVFAFYGLGALVAAAILGLAHPVAAWLAALIVAGALFVVAGIAALIGKKEVQQATPPMPTEAIAGLKRDVDTLKPGANR